jgi:hypothetical protein
MTITYDGNYYTFNSSDRVIFVGRSEGCNINLECTCTSRIHALIYLLPEMDTILVVDVGSQSGIKTVSRSSGQEIMHSLPYKRNVLSFKWNEIVILELGIKKIVLNCKDCLICMEKPRSYKFSCNHYAVCDSCVNKITTCPICRESINKKEKVYEQSTNVKQLNTLKI